MNRRGHACSSLSCNWAINSTGLSGGFPANDPRAIRRPPVRRRATGETRRNRSAEAGRRSAVGLALPRGAVAPSLPQHGLVDMIRR